MRQRLADVNAPIDYRSGYLTPGANLPSLWLSTRQHDCSLGRVLLTPPSNNQRATLQEHYTHGRGFAVCKQCVNHPQYRNTDAPRCPGCRREGVLQRNELRQHTRCVLLMVGQ
jgi:hypothetical protein